jgi:shikimate dehydrogenase
MKEFCLIGHPLGHSISPEIHERLFALSGIQGSYTLKDIEADDFDRQVGALGALSGFNVTIPYKQSIIPFLKSIDDRARRFDAVNTVRCEADGLHGFNTDADGFLRALAKAGIALSGKVLLCGAGGVARMMACEALERGCSLVIGTPTISEAGNCVSSLLSLYPDAYIEASTLAYLSGSFDLILNGTPVGMYPNVKGSPVPLAVARSAVAVFDAVYNPVDTVLLKNARFAGAKVQGGLTMLVEQAAAAQELWTGAHFKSEDIGALCKDMASLLSKKF